MPTSRRRDDRLLRAEWLREDRRSPSTRSMPKGSGATSKACRPTRGSSSARCRSPCSSGSKGSRRPWRSNSGRAAARRDPPWARSRRCTTTSACWPPGSARCTALIAARRWGPRASIRRSTGSSNTSPARGSWCCGRRSSGLARRPNHSSPACGRRAMCGCGSTGRPRTSTRSPRSTGSERAGSRS